jgi:hypothetical protein
MKGRELVRDYGLPTLPGSVPTHHWTKIGMSSLLHLRIPCHRTTGDHHTSALSTSARQHRCLATDNGVHQNGKMSQAGAHPYLGHFGTPTMSKEEGLFRVPLTLSAYSE